MFLPLVDVSVVLRAKLLIACFLQTFPLYFVFWPKFAVHEVRNVEETDKNNTPAAAAVDDVSGAGSERQRCAQSLAFRSAINSSQKSTHTFDYHAYVFRPCSQDVQHDLSFQRISMASW